MRKLSLWAKVHKKTARIIIVVAFVLLTALGIATGQLLSGLAVVISSAVMFSFICVYFISLVVYPARSLRKNKHSFYIRQKSCDWFLAASTFCMIVYLSNRPSELFNYSTTLTAAASLPKDSTIKTYKTVAAFNASLKDESGKPLKWKEKKQLLKKQVRAIKSDNDLSKGAKVALIILSVAVALGLLYLVAALSCTISCNGSAGGAVLVAIGGTGLVIFLLIAAIRAIEGKRKKPNRVSPDPNNSAKPGN